VTAAEYIDLCKARTRLIETTALMTREFDAVLMPTVPIVAPPISHFTDNTDLWLSTNRLLIRNPNVANFLDRCALTLPCHIAGAAPVGLTLMGETMADDLVLSIGVSVERVLNE
jgi:aspartyl-tRNA(Asn)/glutamyl-tRNA(Gln) amidotransferase subunit A